MSTKCTFELDQQDSSYFSGENITGRAVLSTPKEKNIKGIVIHFVGRVRVQWSNGRYSNYSGEEKCVDVNTRMRSQGLLPSGTHYFKISIPIPEKCPSSCDKVHGKIYYELSLEIQHSYTLNNEFTRKITVLQPYDLNRKPELLLPITQTKTNQKTCFCLQASPFKATVNIPLGGYAPGQDINYTLNFNSNTHNAYKYKYKIKVNLNEQCDYCDGWGTFASKMRQTKSLTQSIHMLKPMPTNDRSVSGSLTIPPTIPTTRDQWFIMVSYFLQFRITSPRDINIKVPIEIGTKPIVVRNGWYSDDRHSTRSHAYYRISAACIPLKIMLQTVCSTYSQCKLSLKKNFETLMTS